MIGCGTDLTAVAIAALHSASEKNV